MVKAFETSNTNELLSLSEDQIESAGSVVCGQLWPLGMAEPIACFPMKGPWCWILHCIWEPAKGRGDISEERQFASLRGTGTAQLNIFRRKRY